MRTWEALAIVILSLGLVITVWGFTRKRRSAMTIGSSVKSLWDMIYSWFDQSAEHYVYMPIAKERIDPPEDDTPLEPMASYFRIWVSEMFLAKSRSWGKEWFPAVHADSSFR